MKHGDVLFASYVLAKGVSIKTNSKVNIGNNRFIIKTSLKIGIQKGMF
jgi:hypothetical protein